MSPPRDPERAAAPGEAGGERMTAERGSRHQGTTPLDYLAVAGIVGSKALTYAVEHSAMVILAPDYLLYPEPAELPLRLVEWTERIGSLVHHGTTIHIYYVSDDLTDFALSMIGIEVPE